MESKHGPIGSEVEKLRGVIENREVTVSVITVRMPKAFHQRLNALAKAQRISVNRLCLAALNAALKELEAQ